MRTGRSSTRTATRGPVTGSPGPGTPRRRSPATCAGATRPASAGRTCSPRSTPTTRSPTRRSAGSSPAGPAGSPASPSCTPSATAAGSCAMVRRAVDGVGFCGIKVHRHDARLSREICDVAAPAAAAGPLRRDGRDGHGRAVRRRVPRRRLHHPAPGQLRRRLDRPARVLLGLLAEHPNVYTDTSGVRRFDLLVRAVRRAGPHKVLFGSDGPWLHPGVELAKVRLLRPAAGRRGAGPGRQLPAAHPSAARPHARGRRAPDRPGSEPLRCPAGSPSASAGPAGAPSRTSGDVVELAPSQPAADALLSRASAAGARPAPGVPAPARRRR